MNKFRKVIILYTIVMLTCMIITAMVYIKSNVSFDVPGTYTDEQLQLYKQIWNGLNENMNEFKQKMLIYLLAFWVFIMILGYLLLAYFYFAEIKPITQLQNYATEISKGNLDIPIPVNKNLRFIDFTESFDLMREELKKSKLRELEAENEKRQMVAELSHDLKTPIATIQATCEVLEMQISKKKETGDELGEISGIEEKVGFISQKAETINKLVQNVLHATIDDLEEISVSVEEYDSKLIESYFTSLKDYGNIILDNHIHECLVYMDKLRMEQVVDNIVGNSYKYAGTDIHVSFEETEEMPSVSGGKDRFIKITVRDSGPGVPKDELPLVVEKFYRGSGTEEKNGYGLGLYLVKNYVERQGGGFEYYNDNGFVVVIYVKKV